MDDKTGHAAEKDEFSVFSLNLRFGLANDGPNGWKYRKEGYLEMLAKFRSDFMAFQEVNDFQLEFIRKILPGHAFVGKRESAPERWQNNIVFYDRSWSCVEWGHFFLSDTPERYSRFEQSKWPRQCTIGWFEKNSRRLVFVNTHFDFDEDVQVKSAQVIMKLLSRFPSDAPAILVGDFNCPPTKPCRRIFTGENSGENSGSSGFFKPVFAEPFPGTFHGFTGEPGEDQIDWIMYRGGVSPVESCVIREKFGETYPSDHFPLHAVFRFARNAGRQ